MSNEQIVSTIIVLSLAIAVVVAPGCSRRSFENASIANAGALPAPTPLSVELSTLSQAELSTLQKYAEAYEPKSGREVIPSPPVPDEKISQIISKAANSPSREHEKFVVLIFLRLSRFQIENFNQRYELGRTNPLTKEFYRLIGRTNFKTAEINLAYLADNYVETNPELLEYNLINAEMQRIAKAGERIKKKLDNTSKRASERRANN